MEKAKRPSLARWVVSTARLLSAVAFFAVLAAGVDPADPLNVSIGAAALLKAFCAAFLFWMAGYVVGDLVLKGLVETVAAEDVPVYEGGLIQHVREERLRSDPERAAAADDVKERAVQPPAETAPARPAESPRPAARTSPR